MKSIVNTWPAPAGIVLNQDYEVSVRADDADAWQPVATYAARVSFHKPTAASVGLFEFSGRAQVRVRCRFSKSSSQAVVRPVSAQVRFTQADQHITFTLDRSGKFSVEFDDERLRNLHLFARAIETDPPTPQTPGVIYFGPGVHDLPDHMLTVPGGSVVYVAGGAVVRGMLRCADAKQITLRGRGLIDMSPFSFEPTDHKFGYQAIKITDSEQIVVDGLTIIDSPHYGIYLGSSHHITLRDVAIIGYYEWGDGIDMMSCNDIRIEDVFIRTSDDCLAIYGERWRHAGDARRVSLTRAVLWADKAHNINIGLHGNPKQGDTIADLSFSDIDILDHYEDCVDYQGAMAISCGDNNRVQNVRFENVRVERISRGMLLNVRALFNTFYGHGPGMLVENVVFKDINYAGPVMALSASDASPTSVGANASLVEGRSADRPVRGFEVQNLIIAGKHVRDWPSANITIGKHVERAGIS
jgi:hypothetical protein